VGACIVDSRRRISGTGYNGFPRGCDDDLLPWSRTGRGGDPLTTKYPFVCHAEANAIANKGSADVEGATIFVALFPCCACAKIIIQSRIAEVVYLDDKYHDQKIFEASRVLFDMAGVRCRKLRPATRRIELHLGRPVAPEADGFLRRLGGALWRGAAALTGTGRGDGLRRKEGVIGWDDYFMSVALLSAQRSKDPEAQIGACIVNAKRRMIGIGYNGFPLGCDDDALPWASTDPGGDLLRTKGPFVVPAEVNAILNKCAADVCGATLYVNNFPDSECARFIIQNEIAEVVYMDGGGGGAPTYEASRILFDMAGVGYRRHIPRTEKVVVELGDATDAPQTD